MKGELISVASKATLLSRLDRFSGTFECHITASLQPTQIEEFRQACMALDSQFVLIALGGGDTLVQSLSLQPMLCKVLSGPPPAIIESMTLLEAHLAKRFDIVRVKIEADIGNRGIPTQDGLSLPADCYFEHHVKMELGLEHDIEALRRELLPLKAHLSRNAYRQKQEIEERFATQRFARVGLASAAVQLHALVNLLSKKDIPVIKSIQEFNIFDSNVQLDTGWMVP